MNSKDKRKLIIYNGCGKSYRSKNLSKKTHQYNGPMNHWITGDKIPSENPV